MIYFVRHAESRQNAEHVISTGVPGPPLSDRGAEQATQLAVKLSGLSFSSAFISPALRARQTLDVLRQGFVKVAELVEVAGFAEISAGSMDGEDASTGIPKLNDTWRTWVNDRDLSARLGDDGESAEEAMARFGMAMDEVFRRGIGGNTLVVSHGGILQLGLGGLCLNMDLEGAYASPIPNAGVVLVEAVGPTRLFCRSWASH